MKANELMIGDWVRLRYVRVDTGKVVTRDFQVSRIRESASHTLEVWSKKYGNMGDIDKIEPIPLTPEILEKNGWEKYEDGDGFHDEDCVFIPQRGNSYGVCIDKKRTFSGEIRYVHELQHALRLCGIDKEIVL